MNQQLFHEDDQSLNFADTPPDKDDMLSLADPYPRQGQLDHNGRPIIIIVDLSGVHHIGIEYCCCRNAPPR
jgi:hypothetical protein